MKLAGVLFPLRRVASRLLFHVLTTGVRSIQVKLFRSSSVGPAPVEMSASPELADQWVAE
jgi:hypothetical protein